MNKYEKKFYETLEKLRKKPGLFIGKKDIKRLRDLISGYCCAIYDISKDDIADDGLSFRFQRFIEEKTGISHPSMHWSKIISIGRTNEEAFDEFFRLLDEYKNNGTF